MKTKLVANALPAVLLGTEYVVFSPYSQSLALVDEERIDDPETLSTLQQDGFLGTPLNGGPGGHSPFYDLTLVVTGDCNLLAFGDRTMANELLSAGARESAGIPGTRIAS